MTRISFIMPTFNRARYIAESIETILSQMSANDELVVVDDGSSDGTEAALGPYIGKLRYVRQDNAGKSVALNRGLALTSGQYVWICDDDDLLLPGCVDLLVRTLESTGADMVFGRYTRFHVDQDNRVDMGTGYWPDLYNGSAHRHILEDAFVMHNAALVRREAYARLGPFDPEMLRSQDYEMFARIALSCAITYVDRVVFLQRKHPGDRGPAVIVHGAGKSNEVWERFDRRIFERLRDLVPLDFFVSMYDSPDAALARRAGLLQRACILARHGLWADALGDCALAASACKNHPLHALEIATCRRMTGGKHGFAGLLIADNAAALRSFARQSRIGRAIAGELSRGLLWRLKSDNADNRRAALSHLLQAPNAAGLAVRILTAAKGNDTSQLREREPDIGLTEYALRQWRNAIDASAFNPA